MPTYLKHIAPSFNINSVKGWDTRLIYCYYGSPSGNFTTSDAAAELNIFSALTTNYKGSYQINLPRYFNTGKNLRIKGRFFIDVDVNNVFNIRFGLFDGETYTYVARSNNGSTHTIANGAAVTDLPVDFEIIVTSVEETGGSNFYLQANGFFQYNFGSYNSGGNNLDNAYVPIWNNNIWIGPFNTTIPYNLFIDFDNSSKGVIVLTVAYITIEEFS